MMKELMGEAGINVKKEFWQSYDTINDMIVRELR